MKQLLIARVSTEDQKDALPAQVHRLLDYAERSGQPYELIEFQESAYKGNREEFRQIIKKIQSSKEPVAVVFDKIDRYTRDSSAEEVRILQNLYRSAQIELHFPSDNLVIRQNSPATDIMRLGLGVVLAQYYSDAISDNVKRRLEQKLRDGEWIGMAPVGYKNAVLENGKKWVEVDAETAPAVRAAYNWYASGNYSLQLVKQKLEDEHGLMFGTSQLALVLKNPFYMGQMRVKGQLYPHKYERIISEELYDQTKAVREGYKVEPRIYAGLPYAYRGLIRCADCNCRITFEKKKGKYVYGHCTQWNGKHGAAYVPEQELTNQIMQVFESCQVPDNVVTEVSEALKAEYEQESKNRSNNLILLGKEIAKYERRIERIYDDLLDEVISKEHYERKAAEFKNAVRALEGKRKNIELGKAHDLSSVNTLLRLANKLPQLFKSANFEQKRAFVNLALSNLQLQGDLLRWELKKPFKTMALCSVSSNWLTTIEEVITIIKTDLTRHAA